MFIHQKQKHKLSIKSNAFNAAKRLGLTMDKSLSRDLNNVSVSILNYSSFF